MPSEMSLATIPEMLDAAQAAAWARKSTADVHTGGGYDVHAGVGAMLWIREQVRDRENFALCFDDTATDSALDLRIVSKGGPARIEATRGTGSALLAFSGGATAGTLWAGTRIAVTGVGALPRMYRIASDTPILTTDTGKIVPIEAEQAGSSTAIDTSKLGGSRVTWEDRIFNTGWTITSLRCDAGTDRETDPAYRARWRQGKLDRRVGYPKAISDALVAAGAKYVVLLESDFVSGGDDYGINRAFVADSTYQSPPDLLRACRIAVDSVRVLGCDLTVWGIVSTPQAFDLTINCWDDPAKMDQTAIRTAVLDGALHYFSSRTNGFTFKRDGLSAYIMQQTQDVQSITFGGSDPTDTVISTLMESTALPLLYTTRDLVNVTLSGPV